MICKMCGVRGVEAVDFPPYEVEVQFFGMSFYWRVCRDCVVELNYPKRTAYTKA